MTKKYLYLGFVFLVVITFVRMLIAASVPLSPDEAYYWVWSRALNYSYYDHPPMVALWIKMGCSLWGNTEIGVRFLGPIAALIGSFFVFFVVCDFDGNQTNSNKKALMTVLLLNATLTIGVGGIIMTPDTPLLFFVCVLLWGCGRLIYTKSAAWWWVIGAGAGLALLSKYTAILLIGAIGIWCLLTKEGRGYLRAKALWGGLIVTGLLFLPVIWWNSQNHWISFLKQGGRTSDWKPSRAVQFLSELIGGQIGLATPVIFICFCMGVFALTRAISHNKNKGPAILMWLMVVLPLCVFIQHAVGDRVQANWVGILYPILALIAGLYVTRFLKTAIVTGFLLMGVVYVQTVFAIISIPAKKDMLAKRLEGWPNFVQRVSASVPKGAAIISDSYGLASELKFYAPERNIVVIGDRWKYFSMPTSTLTQGYFIRRQKMKEPSLLAMQQDDYFALPSDKMGYPLLNRLARTHHKKDILFYELYFVELQPHLATKGDRKSLPN